jgi:hypothetical protein
MKFFFLFFIFNFYFTGAFANEKCTSLFSVFGKESNGQNLTQEVIDEIKKLDPYFLDYSNLQKSIDSLLNDIASLREPYAQVKKIEQALDKAQIDPRVAQALSESLAQKLAGEARQILTESHPNTPQVRKNLEGHRLLLSKLQKLAQKSQILAEEQESSEEPLSKKKPASANEASSNNTKKQKPTDENDRPNEQLELSDLAQEMTQQLREQKQRPLKREDVDNLRDQDFQDLQQQAAQKMMDDLKKEEDASQESKKDTDSSSSNEDREAQEALEQRLQEKLEESQQNQKDGEQETPDQSSPKNSDSDEQESSTKKPNPPESDPTVEAYKKALEEWNKKQSKEKKEESSEKSEKQDQTSESKDQEEDAKNVDDGPQDDDGAQQENKGDKSSKDNSKEGQPQEGDAQGDSQGNQGEGQSQDGQGQGKAKQEGQGQSQDSQGEGQSQNSKNKGQPKEGQGQDAPQDGQPQDGESQGQSQEGRKGQGPPQDGQGERRQKNGRGAEETRAENGSQKDGSDGQNEGGASGYKDLMDSLSEFLDQLKTKQKENHESQNDYSKLDREELESLAEKTPKRSTSAENLKGSKESKKREPKAPKKPDLVQNLDQLLETIWLQILNQYQNSSHFMRMVTDFSSLCQTLAVNNPHQAHILQQKIARANELADKLRLLAVEYKDLEDLATSLSSGSSKIEFIRRIHYLKNIFDAKEDAGNLESAEERALQTINEILNQIEKNLDSANNDVISETFRDLLAGPLSRKFIDENYPPTTRKQQLDSNKLVQDLKAGRLNDLVVYNRLKPFVDILFNDLFKPRSFEKFEGPYVPINESDRKLEKLEDFEDIPSAVKEGFPSEIELLRLLAGDMLKNAYPEKVKKFDPRKPYPKRASIVLYDISGSMGSNNKQVLRNALVNAFLDRSQLEVARGEGEHTVYLIPFDARPHEPKIISSLGQAQKFFDDMRERPLGSGGDDSITEGMVKAYELIAEHQKNGGDLERANILLLTDAIAAIDFAKIEKARSQIDASVDLALNAVTFGDWNKDVSKMVTKYAVNGDGNIGKVSHQHIPYEDIQRLLDPKQEIEELIKAAQYFDKGNNLAISDQSVDKARGRLMSVANERLSRDRNAGMHLERWIQKLESLEPSTETNDLTAMFDVFVDTVIGATGKNWSRSGKVSAWESFIESAETQTELSQQDLLSYLNRAQRDRIIHWMQD